MADPTQGRLEWSFLGRVPYGDAEELQKSIRHGVREGVRSEALLLLEHPHVYTLGRNASRTDVLAGPDWLEDHGVEVAGCDRGGQVTYHGPGQLVGYPVINLSPDRRDIRRYVRDLQSVLVSTLGELGIDSEPRHRSEELGVWAQGKKIASIGVHISRWITTHGFALNINTDLEYFSMIVPCGLANVEMTSVAQLVGPRFSVAEVATLCSRRFAEVFDRALARVSPDQLSKNWPIAI